MTIYKTAMEAIRHSHQYGEIGHCNNTPDNHERLMIECDDHCSGNGLEDYWANDSNSNHKMVWRVNVKMSEEA